MGVMYDGADGEREGGGAPPSAQRFPRWAWIALAVVVGSALLMCGGGIALMGISAANLGEEQTSAQRELDEFMRSMARGDVDHAYSKMSARARRVTPRANFELAVTGDDFVLWHNYQSLEVHGIHVAHRAHTNEDMAQGKVAEVTGTVSYSGGHVGQLAATLESEDGTWRIHYVHVTVPPSKIRELDLMRQQ